MKKSILVFICGLFFISKAAPQNVGIDAPTMIADTLLQGDFSIRAIATDKDKVYYATNKNKVGYINLKTLEKKEITCTKDNLVLEFRSIALTKDHIIVASIGNPAVIFKMPKTLNESSRIVYEEKHEKVFYDSMQFWNDKEGMAIGDPIEDCFCILITRDGGETWNKTPCTSLPKLAEGEAAFAASNTNVVIKGNHAWVVSGGKKARVFHSPDKGVTWEMAETPILQGGTMTGIFTADFYNEKLGVVAGGNFEKYLMGTQGKAMTSDGGKTWKLLENSPTFGYISCIQFVPGSKGNGLLCVGATGVHYSRDRGKFWKQELVDNSLYTLRFIDATTAIAAGKNKIVRLQLR